MTFKQPLYLLHKIINILFIFCLVLGCYTYARQQNTPFEILNATSQEWIAGVRGGGKGIKYVFNIKMNTSKKIEFDSVLVDGVKLRTQLQIGPQFKKFANVTITASSYNTNPIEIGRNYRNKTVVPSHNSDTLKKTVLLKYFLEGSVKYFEVSDIKRLPPIYGQ